MKIAIIGTGNVGGTLATQWTKAGYQIFLGVQDTEYTYLCITLEKYNSIIYI